MFRYAVRLQLLTLLSLILFSCVEEDRDNCVQYAVKLHPVYYNGTAVTDTIKGRMTAYLFINDKFDHEVTAEPDGRYYLTFTNQQNVSLVAANIQDADSALYATPAKGDDISSVYMRVKDVTDTGFKIPSQLYYGRFSYQPGDAYGSKEVDTLLTMRNKSVSIHVVVRRLKEYFGDSNDYHIRVTGIRSGLCFDGASTGDVLSVSPAASFNSDNEYVSTEFYALPSLAGDKVMVEVRKGDTMIWHSDIDQNFKPLSLAEGDNLALIVDCGMKELALTVMPWQQYLDQKVIIP